MITASVIKFIASLHKNKFYRWEHNSLGLQKNEFKKLLRQGTKTAFGLDHNFEDIQDYDTFKKHVPVGDYEGIKPYIERIIQGERNVLWPGRPIYFAKTSGTTSGAKYIPITRQSMPNHIESARNALLMYVLKTGNIRFIPGKYIFISGSPVLEKTNGILTGRLSGIVHHHIPVYMKFKKMPTFKTNSINDWEEKLDHIIDETLTENMSLISGIPPWLEMYFERLLARTGKENILEIFPDFSLLVHGGVNFNHYKDKIFRLIGKEIDAVETFPASEGFFAFQDEFPSKGLLLIPDSGIFYEFIPADRIHEENPPRLWLGEVETDVNYALVLNTNAGLWGYSIGDTVRFVSTNPYRIQVSGRLSQYTSAFGEHVIAEEAEAAIAEAAQKTESIVKEFTLTPLVDNPDGLPCHQWFVEFVKEPDSLESFTLVLDKALQEKNAYYRDLIQGKILQHAMIKVVPDGTFNRYMDAMGKLGGQNKVPHLSNERDIAEWILQNTKD
jgi:hypothetical protein